MSNILKQLSDDLPDLGRRQCRRLASHGISCRRDLEDVIRASEKGPTLLSSLLEIPQADLKALLGWSEWPEHHVELGARYPLSGVRPPSKGTSQRRVSRYVGDASGLPDSASLTDRMEKPRDQGAIGSCTAFALTAAVESQLRGPLDLSEAFLYGRTKAIDRAAQSDGSRLEFASAALLRWGTCREKTWPYRQDRDFLRSTPTDIAWREAESYRPKSAVDVQMLNPNNVSAVCHAVAHGQGVAISVPLFVSTTNSLLFRQQGRMLMQMGSGDRIDGYHAMCIVGYFRDTWLAARGLPEQPGKGVFVVRNSWNTTWASENPIAPHIGIGGGFALLPFRYLEEYCFEAFIAKTPQPRRTVSLPAFVKTGLPGRCWWGETSSRLAGQFRERLECGLVQQNVRKRSR